MTLTHGRAQDYTGTADLVFTHPYGPLPPQLRTVPAVINLHIPRGQERTRRAAAERWVGGRLDPIGRWAANVLFVARLPGGVLDLSDLEPARHYPGGGCFPEEMVARVLMFYGDLIPDGGLIWDGFMGRGTVGRVARRMGYSFVGIDYRRDRYEFATEYLAE